MIEETIYWYHTDEKMPPKADLNNLESLDDTYLLFRVKGHRLAEKGYYLDNGSGPGDDHWFNMTHNPIPTNEVELWAFMPKGLES